MTRLPFCLIPAPLALLAVAGCATPAADPRYPSLLPRPIESRSDAEPVAVPVVVAPDRTTDNAIARLRKSFDATTAAFSSAATAAERSAVAARGDSVGGERWITAQVALADLDALRSTTSATLTEIDDLVIARATAGQPPYPALETLRGEVQAASDTQAARSAAIEARLPHP